jgi:hypothetical protein
LAAVGAILALLAIFLGCNVDWSTALGVHGVDAPTLRRAVMVTLFATAVSLPLSVAGRAHLGRQRGWVPALCNLVGSMLQVALPAFGAKAGWSLDAMT